MDYDVKDIKLADAGLERVEWAARRMPVLKQIQERFAKEKPLKGARISCCLHVTTETANLMKTLKAGGAEVALCASNPLSTQDESAAAIVKHFKIPTFAIKGENEDQYYDHIMKALAFMPNITMDDGADLVGALHMIALEKYDALHGAIRNWVKKLDAKTRKSLVTGVAGSMEETTTGVIRLKSMEKENILRFPIVAVNDALTKHMFDNRYGTGQSTIDGILQGNEYPLCRGHLCSCRLRLVRQGCVHAGKRTRRPRHRHGGRSPCGHWKPIWTASRSWLWKRRRH